LDAAVPGRCLIFREIFLWECGPHGRWRGRHVASQTGYRGVHLSGCGSAPKIGSKNWLDSRQATVYSEPNFGKLLATLANPTAGPQTMRGAARISLLCRSLPPSKYKSKSNGKGNRKSEMRGFFASLRMTSQSRMANRNFLPSLVQHPTPAYPDGGQKTT